MGSHSDDDASVGVPTLTRGNEEQEDEDSSVGMPELIERHDDSSEEDTVEFSVGSSTAGLRLPASTAKPPPLAPATHSLEATTVLQHATQAGSLPQVCIRARPCLLAARAQRHGTVLWCAVR